MNGRRVRAPRRDPRRDRTAIDRARRSRELTPEEQVFGLLSAIGNSAAAGLLAPADGEYADAKAGGEADGKSEADFGDAKAGEYGDAKGGDEKAGAAEYADAKGGDEKAAEYGDAKGGDEKADADLKGGGYADEKAAGEVDEKAAESFQIDWLYEMRKRKPRP